MSKRSSTNAKNFSGIAWGFGLFDKKSKVQKEKIKQQKLGIEEQWKSICKIFKFVLTEENKSLYDKMKRAFNGNRTLRVKSIWNVKCFEIYCKVNEMEFTMENYFERKLNTLDYKKKFPEIYLKAESETETEIAFSANTILENLGNEEIQELERLKNTLKK
jgi:hypothetical protein